MKSSKKTMRKQERALEELKNEQSYTHISDFRRLLGGWPEEELNDGFEEDLNRRRKSEIVQETVWTNVIFTTVLFRCPG